jgi:hypothetical protein
MMENTKVNSSRSQKEFFERYVYPEWAFNGNIYTPSAMNNSTTTSSVSIEDILRATRQFRRQSPFQKPKPRTNAENFRNVSEAVLFLHKTVGPHPEVTIDELIRMAEKKTNPDLGGNAEIFKKVQAARETIKKCENGRAI